MRSSKPELSGPYARSGPHPNPSPAGEGLHSSASTARLPYWRLSGFYFIYFLGLGTFLPYWPLYLQAQGYAPAQIGELMALLAATKVISPTLWGGLADRCDRPMSLVRLTSWLTAAGFLMLDYGSGFRWIALVIIVFSFFWNGPLPLFEAVTLSYLREQPGRYARIRMWGSIGFIAAVLGIGHLLNGVLWVECLPQVIFAWFILLGLASFAVRERSVRTAAKVAGTWWAALRRPGVPGFFLAVMLVQVAHGPYYAFFSVHLKQTGFDAASTGQLWTLGVIAEIALFVVLHRLLHRFSLRAILLVSIGLGVPRWLLIGWGADDLWLLTAAQLLHAATFGSTHVAAVQLVHRYFDGGHQGKGQSLYSAMSYGLGGTLGSYAAGRLWESWGAGPVFSLAAAASLAACLVVWFFVERPVPLSARRGELPAQKSR